MQGPGLECSEGAERRGVPNTPSPAPGIRWPCTCPQGPVSPGEKQHGNRRVPPPHCQISPGRLPVALGTRPLLGRGWAFWKPGQASPSPPLPASQAMGKISPPPGPSVAGWAREGCPRVLPSPSGLGSHPGASWEQGLHVGGKGFCGAGARHKGSAWVSPGQAAAQRQALRPRGELSSGTLDAPLKGMPTRGQAPVAWGPHGPLRLPGAELRVANFRPVGRRLSPTPQLPKRHRLLGVVPSTWSPKTCQDGEGWWQHKALRPQVRAITCGGQSRTTQPGGGGALL